MLLLFPLLLLLVIPLGSLLLLLRIKLQSNWRRYFNMDANRRKAVGIFHPYCDAGGGGERVLFCAIRQIPAEYDVIVYTGDLDYGGSILVHCLDNFGPGSTPEKGRVRFVHLRLRGLVEASTWPRFTLIGQSLGSIVLGLEALWNFLPDIFLDTMGYAFTYPLAAAALGSSNVACYVHYPTISTDMLAQVSRKRDGRVSSNRLKYYYYLAFAALYRIVGASANLVMVNSTWTKNHVDSLWRINSKLVFPPCLSERATTGSEPHASVVVVRKPIVVSVGQFRPEKNHELQLRAIQAYNCAATADNKLMLLMIGSCRHKKDEALVESLRRLAVDELGLVEGEDFSFLINARRSMLELALQTSLIGVHTMWNEHFGIGIVEMMHSGLLVVAHDSGGPKSDIITPGVDGFLASTREEYASAFEKIVTGMTMEQRDAMRAEARASVQRFTEEGFARQFSLATSGTLF